MPPSKSSAATRQRAQPAKRNVRQGNSSPEHTDSAVASEDDPFASDSNQRVSTGKSRSRNDAPQRRRQREEASEMDEDIEDDQDDGEDEEEDEGEGHKSIPPELLTRLLHEFFEKDGTRISRDAGDAVGKYMDVFVRETIARAAVEKESGFLEVEDLEKIAPQILLDL